MTYLDRIYACNNFDPADYCPLLIEGKVYGQVRPEFAAHLADWPDVFHRNGRQLELNASLTGYRQRSEAAHQVFRKLHEQGVIDTWVDEAYPVTHDFGGAAEMEVERAASSFLGLKTFGIHVNGLVRKQDGVHVWVGTRTLSKPFWPGKLDQMVAGGQPVGLGLMENVIKEAQEEANIPLALAQQAQAVGTVSYRQSGWRGLDDSTIYIYDLWLPEDFVPENTDGEVSRFELMPLAEVAHLTETTAEFKDNCNLVNIDLLLRMQHLDVKHPDHTAMLKGLRRTG